MCSSPEGSGGESWVQNCLWSINTCSSEGSGVESWVQNFFADLHTCSTQLLYMCLIGLGNQHVNSAVFQKILVIFCNSVKACSQMVYNGSQISKTKFGNIFLNRATAKLFAFT